MSRTRRRDTLDHQRPTQFVLQGTLLDTTPTARDLRKAHADGKKPYKPGRRAKVSLSKGAKAKTRRQLDAVVREPDEAPLPKTPHTHVWDYN